MTIGLKCDLALLNISYIHKAMLNYHFGNKTELVSKISNFSEILVNNVGIIFWSIFLKKAFTFIEINALLLYNCLYLAKQLSRNISKSTISAGIIEDLEIRKIQKSSIFYRSCTCEDYSSLLASSIM